MSRTLVLEVGCEEIPARMIPGAAADLARRVEQLLDQAGLRHGPARAWGGARRLAVQLEQVQAEQADRHERVLGPPLAAAFDEQGEPKAAALGFAKKQGVKPAVLQVFETERGRYVGLERNVPGRSVGEILAEQFPKSVAGMSFPKTMRWADGRNRWVRPVQWLLALYGDEVLPIELFGVSAAGRSAGHRFLSSAPVEPGHAERYREALREAYVLADPAERRERLARELDEAARSMGGKLVSDPQLLEEVADLVEWPCVVEGAFDRAFLELPRELLVTALRHHQKCFSVQAQDGRLLPGFLAVANTDRDRAGHIRRGNEWVVGGRLEDARFFWNEDRRRPLDEWRGRLVDVIFHARLGSYADKADRMVALAQDLAIRIGLAEEDRRRAREAARLAKADLVSSLVGEFPELQGIVGGLLLNAEGGDEAVARAIYDHYRPQGPQDALPENVPGCVVACVDKLDSVGGLIGAGEAPTGSRDPFGLRRAINGVFRIVVEQAWPLSLDSLAGLGGPETIDFLAERFPRFLRERGYTPNEIRAVLGADVAQGPGWGWELHDVLARLEALKAVRGREDFEHLVDLTKRVDNILVKNAEQVRALGEAGGYEETAPAALELQSLVHGAAGDLARYAELNDYDGVVQVIAGLITPVDRFFDQVLVMDGDNPSATVHRYTLLTTLREVLTSFFDVRELAGEAERRP